MNLSFRLTPRAYDDRRNIYLIGTDAIDIIGVPHKHMDVPGYFGDTGS